MQQQVILLPLFFSVLEFIWNVNKEAYKIIGAFVGQETRKRNVDILDGAY